MGAPGFPKRRAVAAAFGVDAKTVRKWVARFRAEGAAGLQDRSSRPHKLHRPTPVETLETIVDLRRRRFTGRQIDRDVGVSTATVSRTLRRAGLSRMRDLEPAEPVRRYERATPGERIHVDIKKLGRFERIGHRITGDRKGQSNGRGVGWEVVHVVIDGAVEDAPADASRSRLLARAHLIRKRLIDDRASIDDVCQEQELTASYVTRIVRLSFLAPDIVADLLAGRLPDVTAKKLMTDTRFPLDWPAQRKTLRAL